MYLFLPVVEMSILVGLPGSVPAAITAIFSIIVHQTQVQTASPSKPVQRLSCNTN